MYIVDLILNYVFRTSTVTLSNIGVVAALPEAPWPVGGLLFERTDALLLPLEPRNKRPVGRVKVIGFSVQKT